MSVTCTIYTILAVNNTRYNHKLSLYRVIFNVTKLFHCAQPTISKPYKCLCIETLLFIVSDYKMLEARNKEENRLYDVMFQTYDKAFKTLVI